MISHLPAAPAVVLLVAAVLAGGCDASPADRTGAPTDAGADSLVLAWIAAAGGEDAWDAARTLRYTVTTVWYDAETGEEQRRRPRFVWVSKEDEGYRVRVERREAEGAYVQVWDGAAAWGTLDGRRLDDSARAVVEIPHVAGDLGYWIGLPWKLRDPGVRLRRIGGGDGSEAVVEVSFDDDVGLSPGDRYWYHFGDTGSPFPTRVDFLKEGLAPDATERTLWRDWQQSGRITYVGQRLYIDAAGRPEKALLFSGVEFGAPIDPALFAAPR